MLLQACSAFAHYVISINAFYFYGPKVTVTSKEPCLGRGMLFGVCSASFYDTGAMWLNLFCKIIQLMPLFFSLNSCLSLIN